MRVDIDRKRTDHGQLYVAQLAAKARSKHALKPDLVTKQQKVDVLLLKPALRRATTVHTPTYVCREYARVHRERLLSTHIEGNRVINNTTKEDERVLDLCEHLQIRQASALLAHTS